MTPATYRASETVTFINESVTFVNEAVTFANEDASFANEAVTFVNEDAGLTMRTRPAQQQARLRPARMPSTATATTSSEAYLGDMPYMLKHGTKTPAHSDYP